MPGPLAPATLKSGALAPLKRTDAKALIPVWYAADLTTGAVLDELPLNPSPISRVIGQPMSCSMDLVISGAPTDWILETAPGRSLIVCVVDDVPLWASIVIGRNRGSGPTAALSLVTPEAYLDRRYASNHTWIGVDECSVAGAGLIGDCAIQGISLTVDAPASGTVTTQIYTDSDDTTILSALTSLMQLGSPELTVDVAWSDATMTSFELIVRLRHKLGTQNTTPNAVFEMPGCVTGYDQNEDYSAGKGATLVRAYGNGEGISRASSGDISSPLIGGGWPRWDYRWTPQQSTIDTTVLTAAAQKAIALMAAGTSVWTVDANAGTAPRVGSDFGLGDSVALLVQPTQADGTVVAPGHPDGVDQMLRVLGWTLDFAAQKLTPVFAGGS